MSRSRESPRTEKARPQQAAPPAPAVIRPPDPCLPGPAARRCRDRESSAGIDERDRVDLDAVEGGRSFPRSTAVGAPGERVGRLSPAGAADADEDRATVRQDGERARVTGADSRDTTYEAVVEIREHRPPRTAGVARAEDDVGLAPGSDSLVEEHPGLAVAATELRNRVALPIGEETATGPARTAVMRRPDGSPAGDPTVARRHETLGLHQASSRQLRPGTAAVVALHDNAVAS